MTSSRYIDFLAKLKLNHAHPGGALLTEFLLNHLQPEQNETILDLGCGTGATAAFIRNRYGSEVTAVDLHPEMVKAARTLSASLSRPFNVLQANAEYLPFENQTFHFVFSESVSAFTDLRKSLPEACRVLKKGGEWIGIEMTTNHKCVPEISRQIQQFYGVKEVLTEREWMTALKQAGFSKVEIVPGLQKDHFHHQEAILPVEKMDADDLQLWWTHVTLMDQWRGLLTYRIYKAKK